MGKRIKAKSKQEKLHGILALCALTLTVITVGVVLARYVFGQEGQAIVAAREFYFTSDLLTEEGAEYTLATGSTSVSFDLRNYADELRITGDNISYSVTLETDEMGCSLKNSSGILTGGSANENTVTLSMNSSGKYTVTAVTNTGSDDTGYQAEISATFIVPEPERNVYKYLEDQGDYVLFTVWTESVIGDMQIAFPAGLIPDNTDPALANVTNFKDGQYKGGLVYDQETFQSESYASHAYRFFKSGDSEYRADDFEAVLVRPVENLEAVEKTP